MESKMPWLKLDGTLKSEEELKRSCKDWSPSIWEDYLKTLEADQEEILLDDPVLIEEHSQEECDVYRRSVFDVREFPLLKKYLLDAFKELTCKQKEVLSLIFWDELMLREVGERMGITTVSVFRIRDRALKKLGLILMKRIVSKIPQEKNTEICL